MARPIQRARPLDCPVSGYGSTVASTRLPLTVPRGRAVPTASTAAGIRRSARGCPEAPVFVCRCSYVRDHQLSVHLNDGAIAEAASRGNFHVVGHDASVDCDACPYAHVIPDDAGSDLLALVEQRPAAHVGELSFSVAHRDARLQIIRGCSNVPESGLA